MPKIDAIDNEIREEILENGCSILIRVSNGRILQREQIGRKSTFYLQ